MAASLSPSSLDRRYAAHTESLRVVRKPPRSAMYRAEAVVPPGDVISLRNTARCLPGSSLTCCAVPNIVWMTSLWANSRDKPMCTPLSTMASMTIRKYAGPDPLKAVQASSRSSLETNSSSPISENSFSITLRRACPTSSVVVHTVIPSCTVTLVLGMERHTRWRPVPFTMVLMEVPARIEMAVHLESSGITLRRSRNTESAVCGLMAKTIMSQFASISAPSNTLSNVVTPNCSVSSLRRFLLMSTTPVTWNVFLFSTRPPMNAPAIFPPPRNATLTGWASGWSGSCMLARPREPATAGRHAARCCAPRAATRHIVLILAARCPLPAPFAARRHHRIA
mmetsp:Transcript_13668/g.25294  ORF Transcript_13668/g.25294 Transcript_13668/m.25294 type:complete len:338 (-) Transcript_13668:22-1035(-)